MLDSSTTPLSLRKTKKSFCRLRPEDGSGAEGEMGMDDGNKEEWLIQSFGWEPPLQLMVAPAICTRGASVVCDSTSSGPDRQSILLRLLAEERVRVRPFSVTLGLAYSMP